MPRLRIQNQVTVRYPQLQGQLDNRYATTIVTAWYVLPRNEILNHAPRPKWLLTGRDPQRTTMMVLTFCHQQQVQARLSTNERTTIPPDPRLNETCTYGNGNKGWSDRAAGVQTDALLVATHLKITWHAQSARGTTVPLEQHDLVQLSS